MKDGVKKMKLKKVSGSRSGRKPQSASRSFSAALEAIKAGGFVSRSAWEEGSYLFLVGASGGKTLDLPRTKVKVNVCGFIAKCTPDGLASPYVPTHEDLLSNDWFAA